MVNEAIRVTIAPGESVYLDAAALLKAQGQVLDFLEQRVDAVQSGLTIELDQGLKRIFTETEGHISGLSDWYYSLAGDARLFYALAGNLPGYLTEKLDELVFTPAGTAEAIDNLSTALGDRSAAAVADAAQEIQDQLTELVRANSLTADKVRVTGEWDLNGGLSKRLMPYLDLTSEDVARQGLATTAGTAIAAAMTKKLGSAAVAKAAGKLAAKPAAGTAAALTAKLGLKSAAKAGGTAGAAGTGAAAGATLCAGTVVGVPLSPGCALIGGMVTGISVWLLVDKVVIEADEYLYREDFEADLHLALVDQCTDVRTELSARYIEGTVAMFQRLRDELQTELSPHLITPTQDYVPARDVNRSSVRP